MMTWAGIKCNKVVLKPLGMPRLRKRSPKQERAYGGSPDEEKYDTDEHQGEAQAGPKTEGTPALVEA